MKNTTLILLILPLLLYLGGCASTMSGRGMAAEGAAARTAGLNGKSRETIIKTLGDPDFVTSESGSEYWGYHVRDAWHLNLYYGSAGKVEASDVVMKLTDGRVVETFMIDKGSSLGIISAPLSMRD